MYRCFILWTHNVYNLYTFSLVSWYSNVVYFVFLTFMLTNALMTDLTYWILFNMYILQCKFHLTCFDNLLKQNIESLINQFLFNVFLYKLCFKNFLLIHVLIFFQIYWQKKLSLNLVLFSRIFFFIFAIFFFLIYCNFKLIMKTLTLMYLHVTPDLLKQKMKHHSISVCLKLVG